jgi:hypothetical protein
MSVYGDSLSAFGNAQVVEIPPDLSASPYGGIKNTNDAVAKNPLGTLYRYKGNLYRYVKFDNGSDNVAAVAYGVVHWKSLDPTAGIFIVTSDYSSGLATINCVAGILGTTVVTDLYYTWIQVGGVASALVAAGSAIGDVQIGASSDTVFGHIDADATITSVPFGVGLTGISSSRANIILCAAVLASF